MLVASVTTMIVNVISTKLYLPVYGRTPLYNIVTIIYNVYKPR
jgi:uncharacterized protein (UPF0147 family)